MYTARGTLKSASRPRQVSMISFSNVSWSVIPGAITKATTTWSRNSWCLPTTATCPTPGTVVTTSSTSRADTFSPPTLSRSLSRSR